MPARKKKKDIKAAGYRIEYDPETEDHLAVITARDQATVLDKVVEQLSHEPKTATRNPVGIKDRDRVTIGGEEIDLS